MRRRTIVTRAVEKARQNGYKRDFDADLFLRTQSYYDHDFAQAFWPKAKKVFNIVPDSSYSNRKPYKMNRTVGRSWQWHLQQMVVAEDPIKYLEQFLEECE